MIDFQPLYQAMRQVEGLAGWAELLPAQIEQALGQERHGDLDRWLDVIARLPAVEPGQIHLDRDQVGMEGRTPAERDTIDQTTHLMKQLHPWRKGPYRIDGIEIETEWRSDWKWQRLIPHIQPLAGRTLLDVGCGNGYHCWRMLGEGAKLVIGIDPTQLYLAQFLAIRHFLGTHWPIHLLPLGIESLPDNLAAFDTLFSMGILYHRRSPMDHLMALRGALRSGGELVLETLVIEGDERQLLVPKDRYAKMRNVWFIPATGMLEGWLRRCGFREVRLVDLTPTRIEEQRSTEWMRFESLQDFLDPADPTRTVEGYPAPLRAILVATAP